VGSEEELRALLAGLPADEPVVVQERLDGDLTAVALVLDAGGEVVARFQQRATRTWPLDGGPSAAAESVPADGALVDRARALLAGAGYAGLAQLQFLEGGEAPVLIDVNPRFYGSLPLALAAGCDLPAAWHAVATGGEAPAQAAYRVGLRYRWLEGSLLAARHGRPGALVDAGVRPRVGAVWSASDPLAGIAWTASAAGERVARRLGRGAP
jgi:predicted ATP-grasp superfamily ATP-dependent carboligase